MLVVSFSLCMKWNDFLWVTLYQVKSYGLQNKICSKAFPFTIGGGGGEISFRILPLHNISVKENDF